MAKSDQDHSLRLLDMAGRDFKALTNMMDRGAFDEEVFGFHAQQAIEKTLKAWIAYLGRAYPKSHDVSALVSLLRGEGADVEQFSQLEDFTIFAVQYRYEAYDESEERL